MDIPEVHNEEVSQAPAREQVPHVSLRACHYLEMSLKLTVFLKKYECACIEFHSNLMVMKN